MTTFTESQIAVDRVPSVWLRANMRVVVGTSIFAVILCALPGLVAIFVPEVGITLLVMCGTGGALAVWFQSRPWLRYKNGRLFVRGFLFWPGPCVSVAAIECFLVIPAPSMLKGRLLRAPTASIVLHMDEREMQFVHRGMPVPYVVRYCLL